ncbi:hypothetical protein BKA93DRAFT_749676 [Sparassis latifolia]
MTMMMTMNVAPTLEARASWVSFSMASCRAWPLFGGWHGLRSEVVGGDRAREVGEEGGGHGLHSKVKGGGRVREIKEKERGGATCHVMTMNVAPTLEAGASFMSSSMPSCRAWPPFAKDTPALEAGASSVSSSVPSCRVWCVFHHAGRWKHKGGGEVVVGRAASRTMMMTKMTPALDVRALSESSSMPYCGVCGSARERERWWWVWVVHHTMTTTKDAPALEVGVSSVSTSMPSRRVWHAFHRAGWWKCEGGERWWWVGPAWRAFHRGEQWKCEGGGGVVGTPRVPSRRVVEGRGRLVSRDLHGMVRTTHQNPVHAGVSSKTSGMSSCLGHRPDGGAGWRRTEGQQEEEASVGT